MVFFINELIIRYFFALLPLAGEVFSDSAVFAGDDWMLFFLINEAQGRSRPLIIRAMLVNIVSSKIMDKMIKMHRLTIPRTIAATKKP
jgi:hypothetical protein